MNKQSPYKNHDNNASREAAINLIKQRIKNLYSNEDNVPPRSKSELVDRFWEQHKDNPNPQAEWQRFYAKLSDEDKHSLWNEYHQTSSPKSKRPLFSGKPPKTNQPIATNNVITPAQNLSVDKARSKKLQSSAALLNKDSIKDTKRKLIDNFKKPSDITPEEKQKLKERKSRAHWRPLIIALSVMAIWLFAQYNPLVVAFAKQYVSPGDTLHSPVIIDPNTDIEVSDESRIIIPKINVDVPVVYDVRTRSETSIQNALERGVVHYAGTSRPGEAGNNVIVGHSSNNFLNSGKYKFAFVLLDRLSLNDTFILHYQGTRYVYKITNKQVIEPTDFSLISPTSTPTVTLITCTPPGTSWRRLVIQAEQISPTATPEQLDITNIPDQEQQPDQEEIVPGNAPSLWQRLTGWL